MRSGDPAIERLRHKIVQVGGGLAGRFRSSDERKTMEIEGKWLKNVEKS